MERKKKKRDKIERKKQKGRYKALSRACFTTLRMSSESLYQSLNVHDGERDAKTTTQHTLIKHASVCVCVSPICVRRQRAQTDSDRE